MIMKQFIKKMICYSLTLLLIWGLSVNTQAADNPTAILSALAENIIQIAVAEDQDGFISTTYTDLDIFVNAVRENHSNISELNIAEFIMQYTQQEYEGLPDDQILSILEFDNITSTCSYVRIDNNGTSHVSPVDALPYASWTSNDGYMKITTNYSYDKSVGNNKYYVVWATANWIKMPAVRMEDSFTLGTSGTFDDSYSEFAYVTQNSHCANCPKDISNYREVSSTDLSDDDLELKYSSYTPYITFDLSEPRCSSCVGPTGNTMILCYLKYRISCTGNVNVQATYAHKTFGIGDITLSVSTSGIPDFSVPFGTTITEYTARAITVAY